MKKVLRKSNLVAGILVLIVVCLGIVFAGDVIVKQGVVEGVKFKSTGCTATGTKAIAFGEGTTASGIYSTAMGYDTTSDGLCSTAMGGYGTTASGWCSIAMGLNTTASGDYSTAMGQGTTASGRCSTAIGYYTTAGQFFPFPASYTTAIGKYCTNYVQDSFAVGFGTDAQNPRVDFRVESGKVTVGDRYANEGILVVGNYVDANDYLTHSSFYDKDTYGKALDYSEDSSKTIKVNPEGKKEYNHEADPIFIKKWVTVKDYDKYTEEEVWDDVLKKNVTRRIYQTHQELRSNLSMKVAWLRQCVFELKQENQTLKGEIVKLKNAVGIE